MLRKRLITIAPLNRLVAQEASVQQPALISQHLLLAARQPIVILNPSGLISSVVAAILSILSDC